MRAARAVVAAIALWLAVALPGSWLTVGATATAAAIDDVRALIAQGQYREALTQVDAHLDQSPDDPQGRFLRGVLLAETKRIDEAIQVFSDLTIDFPDLPEPHNNLAVLYAAQGDYERARDALVMAISTHPSYATAHENLGDIYAKMAGIAYDQALELDSANRSAKAKLGFLSDLFSVRGGSAPPRAQPSVAAAIPPVSATVPTTPVPITTASASTSPTSTAVDAAERERLLAALSAWAQAWSSQDVNLYLSFYADNFVPVKGTSRNAWAAQRRARLSRPKFVEIGVSDPLVEMRGVDRAQLTFTQEYRSDTYRDRVRKRLQLAWTGSDWKIIGERSLP